MRRVSGEMRAGGGELERKGILYDAHPARGRGAADSYRLDASESASTWHRTHITHWRVCVTVTR